MGDENGAEIPLADPVHTRGAGERHLLRTDIYAFRFKAVRLQQSDELVTSTAKIDDGSGRRPRQQGTDVALVNENSRLVSTVTGVL